MKNMIKLIITIVILGMCCSIAQAIDYYVSPSGLDSNTGTIKAPFKTITKARDTVRTVNTGMKKNINVYLRGGTYTLDSTIAFTSADSGNNGYDVIYQAYPGEYPVISGGYKITGWKMYDKSKNI